MFSPNYDRYPSIPVAFDPLDLQIGWRDVAARLRSVSDRTLCIECYPGVDVDSILNALKADFAEDCLLDMREFLLPKEEIDRLVKPHLTDDPVFGRMNAISIQDFFAPLTTVREKLRQRSGRQVICGVGASLLADSSTVLIYADLARWEIQQRQRRGELGNLGAMNEKSRPSEKYKRAYFVDWRAADRLKKEIFERVDYFLDTHRPEPKLLSAHIVKRGLDTAVSGPFRVVPFFDPGPWGGQWMKKICGLPKEVPNYAWCFDCVPEENSLLLGLGAERFEMPALNLVYSHPVELLGNKVHARFGAEFPIRFDFLDTMAGGNLSLQVHPLTEFIQDHFGVHYTQDESYYILEAEPDATVYLGVKEGISRDAMIHDLRQAQTSAIGFPAEKYINRWPSKKHDHFLIPAGTIHCSGKNSMVLEISATPYIFTFKLWDWGRLGLDGRPRPIHLDYGIANIQWSRTNKWVAEQLINRIDAIAEGPGWREERTGLHEREFIETRRHWFTEKVLHHTDGGVNVLNLVEGREAVVESPTEAFDPFVVHYAETFIVPAAVGEYTIRPVIDHPKQELATIKAYVRT